MASSYISPELLAVVVLDDEEDENIWHNGSKGGGYVVPFGDCEGRTINRTPIIYLEEMNRDASPNIRKAYKPFFKALNVFLEGLRKYARDNYKDFIVPYGKHRGKKIRQCQDKNWFLWVIKEPGLPSPIPVFLTAVEYYLGNPRHYEVTRDIGRKTARSGRAVNDEEPNTDDEAFISDSETQIPVKVGRGKQATHRKLGSTYRSGKRQVPYLSPDVSDYKPKRKSKHRRSASSAAKRLRNQFVHRPDEAERSDSASNASFVVDDSASLIYDTPTEDEQTSSTVSEASERLRGRKSTQKASSSLTPLRKKMPQSDHDSDTIEVISVHGSDSEPSARVSPTPSYFDRPPVTPKRKPNNRHQQQYTPESILPRAQRLKGRLSKPGKEQLESSDGEQSGLETPATPTKRKRASSSSSSDERAHRRAVKKGKQRHIDPQDEWVGDGDDEEDEEEDEGNAYSLRSRHKATSTPTYSLRSRPNLNSAKSRGEDGDNASGESELDEADERPVRVPPEPTNRQVFVLIPRKPGPW